MNLMLQCFHMDTVWIHWCEFRKQLQLNQTSAGFCSSAFRWMTDGCLCSSGSWDERQTLGRGHESWEMAVWVQEPQRQIRDASEGERGTTLISHVRAEWLCDCEREWLCVCVCALQKLICERDTLKETTVELRCAQVQQQCLTGHTHCIYRQKHKPCPLSHCQPISSLSPCVCRFSERCFRSRRQPGGRDHAYRAQVSTSRD